MPLTHAHTTDRPVRLTRRRDLVVQPLAGQIEPHWGVKDPLALSYFQLNEHEHWLFTRLDEAHSLAELRRDFELQFPGLRLSNESLQHFLARLHTAGLITSSALGQGAVLHERHTRQQREQRWQQLVAPWQMRLRGVDPDRWLAQLAPYLKWAFSPVAAASYVLLGLSALLLLTVQWERTLAQLPAWSELWQPGRLLYFVGALIITKVLHELGHAFACKHYGGECHELGVLFIFGVPCLYCDVSDTWLLGKQARLVTSAAGMVVELLLASAATWIWWFTQPGVLHDLAWSVMLIGGVNSVLVNGNPLLKYDGYYLLSDLVEQPNLRDRAQHALRQGVARLLFGTCDPLPESAPLVTSGMAVYAAGSMLYAGCVLTLSLWAMYQYARPLGLSPVVTVVAASTVLGMLASPTAEIAQQLRRPTLAAPGTHARPWLVLAAAVLAVGLLLALPLPRAIVVPAVAEPADARAVYVTVPGRIVTATTQTVPAGAVIAQLDNDELQHELLQIQTARDRQAALVESLVRRSVRESLAADELPTARRALSDLDDRLARRQREQQQLSIRAPVSGAVLPAAFRPHTELAEGELPRWNRDPLADENRGAWLDPGTLLCWIGDAARRDVLLLVDQADVGALRVGQPVEVLFAQLGGVVLSGELSEIAARNVDRIPPEFAAQLDEPEPSRASDGPDWAAHRYFARVRLTGELPPLSIGARGEARLRVANESLAARLSRWWHTTVRIE